MRTVNFFWKLYKEFCTANTKDKYQFPFPLAVFGTLRILPVRHANSYLMGHKISNKLSPNYKCYQYHVKSFLPHMLPCGLWLEYKKNSSGVAEIFIYNKHHWNNAIGDIDSLEGFHPLSKSHGGYCRTLVKARLLPNWFRSDFYDKNSELFNGRDLKIPVNNWHLYPELPVWTYANYEVNEMCKCLDSNPVLWYN